MEDRRGRATAEQEPPTETGNDGRQPVGEATPTEPRRRGISRKIVVVTVLAVTLVLATALTTSTG